jgi:hypothetical protein
MNQNVKKVTLSHYAIEWLHDGHHSDTNCNSYLKMKIQHFTQHKKIISMIKYREKKGAASSKLTSVHIVRKTI